MPAKKNVHSQIPKDYEQLKGSERHPSPAARLLGPADPGEVFSVTIVLRRRPDGPPIRDFAQYAKTPLSQRRRAPQSRSSSQRGAAPEEIQKVTEFAKSHGLTLLQTHIERRAVVISGTVQQMSSAFGVALGRYQHQIPSPHENSPRTEIYRGREGFIHVPKDLVDIIVGVFGLDNRTITQRHGNPGDPPVANPLTVQAITKFYNFPTNSAAGQTIGIASPSSSFGGYFLSDLQKYFGASLPTVTAISADHVNKNGSIEGITSIDTPAGQSVLTFTALPGIVVGSYVYPSPGITYPSIAMTVSGNTVTLGTWNSSGQLVPQPVSADIPAGTHIFFNPDGETSQDIIIAAAAAPGASICVYFSSSDEQGWVALLNRAVHPEPGDPQCSVLSSSFYICDGDDVGTLANEAVSTGFVDAVHALLEDAADQPWGMTICIAAGDTGSNSKVGSDPAAWGWNFAGDGKAHVSYPGSDPWVLSVGGTTLGSNAANPPPYVEYVWNDPYPNPGNPQQWGTTGGGVSDHFDLPSYQANANVPKSINDNARVGRGIPDVAANASEVTGYSGLFLVGQPSIGNGTSASSPLWAGLIAVINAGLGYNVGFVNPILYAMGSSVFKDINPPPGPADNSNSGIAGYPAGPGWDACTGWGSPNGTALLAGIKQQLGQDCYIVLDQPEFSEPAVAAGLAQSATVVYQNALFVIADGFTPAQLQITPANLNSPPVIPLISPLPTGIAFSPPTVQPADPALLSSNPNAPQRFTFLYNIIFSDTSAFPSATVETSSFTVTAAINATVNGNPVSVSSSAQITLINVPSPFFAGASGISWLSGDLRVFQVDTPGEWIIRNSSGGAYASGVVMGNTGNPVTDATGFIQQFITFFNRPDVTNASALFDLIPADETGSQLDLLPTNPANNNPVYNFAVARVRYNATSINAQSVRVFFRLMPALTTSVAYDTTTNYRRWSDGNQFGQAIPLLGLDPATGDVVTIPFFATPRVDVTLSSMDIQTDAPNVQEIDANGGTEVDAFFGCWLDINQIGAYPSNLSVLPSSVPLNNPDGPYAASAVQTIQTLVMNQHQCLVTEIAFDPDPISPGVSPSTSGPLAQRNLSLGTAANPGDPGSRRVPNVFTVRPTPAFLDPIQRCDELMIDWGDTPAGSLGAIYLPAVTADAVLQLAARMYLTHNLTMADRNTIQCPVGGITYIPIPPASTANFAGLVTVDLPLGIRKGQSFDVVVRQVTSANAGQKEGRFAERRRVLGSFQITIPISTKEAMLIPEQRTLSVLKWIQKSLQPSSLWSGVFQRYVRQIAQRVQGLGANPTLILPSPSGDGLPSSKLTGGKSHPHKNHLEFTGKVTGMMYDRFGDFEGFTLCTQQGDERCFKSREREIERLVERAWVDRILISVFTDACDVHSPASIILRI